MTLDGHRTTPNVVAHALVRHTPAIVAMLVVGLSLATCSSAAALTFVVNSTSDLADAAPGDGVCAAASGVCTLRAAIQESNAHLGPDAVILLAGTYFLAIPGANEDAGATGDLDIDSNISITGTGTGFTIINGGTVNDRIFDVHGASTVTIAAVTIRNGNAAGGAGGGIRNEGTLTLQGITMVGNLSAGDGGAIVNFNSGTLSLTNVTISGNTSDAAGGGIANFDDGSIELTNVTINNNSANAGGGLRNLASARLVNTIIANSPAGGNCSGSLVLSIGHNLDSGNTCVLRGPFDVSNVNPLLGPLQDNGGFTFTHALLAGSPAIDAGDDSRCPQTDQRGALRPTDGNTDGTAACDIGAYEVPGALPPTPTSSPTGIPTNTPPPPTVTITPVPPTSTPGQPAIVLSTANGMPGAQVSFSATLNTQGRAVGSAQGDIAFDGVNTPVGVLPNGAPDCAVNAELNKQPLFVFRPIDCSGTSCTTLRGAIFGVSFPIGSIPDGSVLYTCRVNISPDAPTGEYPLTLSRVVLSDLEGKPVTDAIGTSGKIVVVSETSATPTAPPTATPTRTASATPTTTNTATPTATASPTSTPTRTATVSPTSTVMACTGDCSRNGTVTVDEIITMVNIALGTAQIPSCLAGDADGNGRITVDEIITAVNNTLNGCSRPRRRDLHP